MNQVPASRSNTDLKSQHAPLGRWRGRGRRRLFFRSATVLVGYMVAMVMVMGLRVVSEGGGEEGSSPEGLHMMEVSRHRRDAGGTEGTSGTSDQVQNSTSRSPSIDISFPIQNETVDLIQNGTLLAPPPGSPHKNCTSRDVYNFPDNFMSLETTQHGGIIVHILIILYMFAALAVICDDYFVPSIETICEALGLQPDVAGATFMAAGSSAPELAISVVGVFFAESDIGIGTIVGSAVFNILFVIGIIGICAGMVVELSWFPLLRDTLFYLLSVFLLFIAIWDQMVEWYESLIMVLFYGVYILLMYHNRRVEAEFNRLVRSYSNKKESFVMTRNSYKSFDGDGEEINNDVDGKTPESQLPSSENNNDYDKSCDDGETYLTEKYGLGTGDYAIPPAVENGPDSSTDESESVWAFPETFCQRCLYILIWPITLVFFLTVPDSRKPGLWCRLYMLTFFMSVVWISVLTYLLVWMVTIVGDAMNIPDTVLGLTLLTAGASVPDCMASVFVARDGNGDMGVANAIGSNSFDILICLGITWLIKSAISNGAGIHIASEGLLFSTLTLLATVAFLLIGLGVNKMRLNKGFGAVCMVAYFLATTLCVLYELDVFGDFNPPTCPRLIK